MTERAGRDAADKVRAQLLRAFPSTARSDAQPAVDLVPLTDSSPVGLIHESNNSEWPAVTFDGGMLEIPDRIYNDFPAHAITTLAPASRVAAGCIYTRHYDGHTRQQALHLALSHDVEWSAPFVVQLLGEYIVEICVDIERFLADAPSTHPNAIRGLRHFTESNPDFMTLTRHRAASYWSEYYRADYATADDYPAIRALRRLDGGPR